MVRLAIRRGETTDQRDSGTEFMVWIRTIDTSWPLTRPGAAVFDSCLLCRGVSPWNSRQHTILCVSDKTSLPAHWSSLGFTHLHASILSNNSIGTSLYGVSRVRSNKTL